MNKIKTQDIQNHYYANRIKELLVNNSYSAFSERLYANLQRSIKDHPELHSPAELKRYLFDNPKADIKILR